MLALVAGGPLSQRELSERTGYDRTTMVGIVDELERLELVIRRRGERDRRRFFIVPTQQGSTALEGALRRLAVTEERLFDRLATADRARLDGLLRTLLGEPRSR